MSEQFSQEYRPLPLANNVFFLSFLLPLLLFIYFLASEPKGQRGQIDSAGLLTICYIFSIATVCASGIYTFFSLRTVYKINSTGVQIIRWHRIYKILAWNEVNLVEYQEMQTRGRVVQKILLVFKNYSKLKFPMQIGITGKYSDKQYYLVMTIKKQVEDKFYDSSFELFQRNFH